MIYKGIKVIPTYPDVRLKTTIKNSIKVLNDNKSIVIFPEDSNNGYFKVLTEFFPGFIMLSEQYYKLYNIDLPIYPLYYNHHLKQMIIGFPMYIQKLKHQGLNREEISNVFCNAVNDLYFKFCEN